MLRYSDMIRQRFAVGPESYVIEVAANDGYLLKIFVAAGIPCLGIEPTAGTAEAAERLGIPVLQQFFGETLGRQLAEEGRAADLIIGNNVYAHVPNINDFTRGLHAALKPEGVVTLEFPHLLRMVESRQFDTVYHEHFSYLSLLAASQVFREADLRIFDAEKLPTHGGSLRVYGCRTEASHPETLTVATLIQREIGRGMNSSAWYGSFQQQADAVKNGLLAFLLEQKRLGKTVAGYGAAAKGSTLLNYAGVRPDLLPFVCDAAASKQGKYLPGSRIPILASEVLRDRRPDYLLVLPWNIATEVKQQNGLLAEQGTQFVGGATQLEVT